MDGRNAADEDPGTPPGGCWPMKLCLDVTVLWPMVTIASHGQETDGKDSRRGQVQAIRM